MLFKGKKFLNVTRSSKVDVGDVSVSEGSSKAAEQPKSNKKQIDVTGKFKCYRFGYRHIVEWSIYMLVMFSNNLSFSNAK